MITSNAVLLGSLGGIAVALTSSDVLDVVWIPIVGLVVGFFLFRLLGMLSSEGQAERLDEVYPDEMLADFELDAEEVDATSADGWVYRLPTQRYANVALADSKGRRSVVAKPGETVSIEVDIGPWREDSDVRDLARQPFPDDLLPRHDLKLRVLLSSAEMEVGTADALGTGDHAIEQELTLPGRGSSTVGSAMLRFTLRLPPSFWRSRARLSYLYRDTVIQSQRLDLVARQPPRDDGECEVLLFASTDFTLSERLADDLEEIVPRRRVSVVANSNSGNVHEITIRSPLTEGGEAASVAFQVDEEGVARVAERMRKQIHDRAPRSRLRSATDLGNDLRKLAPIGWELFGQIERGARRLVSGADNDAVVQVAMLHEAGFSLPWNFVYDIFIDSEANLAKIDVCPVVDRLGSDLSVDVGTRRCPCEEEVSHRENLLCPFGFWGYRYSFELLMSGKAPKSQILLGDAGRIVVAKTERSISREGLRDHVGKLSERFQRHDPALTLSEASTKAEVRSELSTDLPFVYFICHGFKNRLGATLLGVGKGETIQPTDIDGWVETVFRNSEHELWTDPQPLIFINACASLAIDPKDLAGYLEAFIGTAQAVGVIGTEARVHQVLAMEVGEMFFDQLLTPGATVDSSLREIKASFLNDRNLTGLVYTPYCFADLHVAGNRL